HEATFLSEAAQGAQNLVFAAEVGKFARQEHVLALPAGDAILNFLPQCLRSRHDVHLQKPDM
ncbi:MAG TPA: hypothetical protein VEK73_20200, partial [Xanthobacteraceae bacterium]|nr:hypothetical protein [Xanthobacteraceae bacterium]